MWQCWPRAEPTTGNEKPVLLGAAQRLAGRERYSYSSLKSEKNFQTFFSAHDQWLGLGETQERKLIRPIMITSYLAREERGERREERGWLTVSVGGCQLFPLWPSTGWELCNDKVPVSTGAATTHSYPALSSKIITFTLIIWSTPVHSCHISFYFLPGPLSNWQVGSYIDWSTEWSITISGKKVISNQLTTTIWISYGSMHEK